MKNQLIEVFLLEANVFNWFEHIFWLICMLWKTMVKRISLKCDFFPWKLMWPLFILYVGFTWLTPYFSTSLCFNQVHSIWYYFITSKQCFLSQYLCFYCSVRSSFHMHPKNPLPSYYMDMPPRKQSVDFPQFKFWFSLRLKPEISLCRYGLMNLFINNFQGLWLKYF